MDKKMSSVQFFNFVIKQLPYETVEQIISVALMNLNALLSFYIPQEHVLEKRSQMFEMLVGLLAKEGISETTKGPLVDNIFGFITSTPHVKLAIEWLKTGKIFMEGAPDKVLFTMA